MDLREEMDVWIRKNENTDMHFVPDILIYFVVEGDLRLVIKEAEYLLHKDDFMLVNSGMQHSIQCRTEDTVLCCVNYSCRCVAEMSGKESSVFFCSSVLEKEPKYHEMRRHLHELVYSQVQRQHSSDCLKRSILYRILDGLLEYFRRDLGTDDAEHADDLKMMQIFQYVNQNFQESVSLTELADRLYMSKSTLSRFFKKQTGIYFADYVNQVRLKYAIEDLVYSKKNITKIAVDCGFSNPSAFNKAFREAYGLTPTEYRAQKGQQDRAAAAQAELGDTLREELKEKLRPADRKPAMYSVRVQANMRTGTPYPKKWGQMINIGSAFNLTVANLQYHTIYLKEQLGFRYARLWSVFSKKLMICDGTTKGYYNYDRIDVVLDFLVSNQIKPFLEFGNRPDTAIFEPGKPVYCEDEYIPFASKEIWQDLLRDFILHITNRYGLRETSDWIFEFSCDTANKDIRTYYEDPDYSYNEVFKYAINTIHQAIPDAKVGGPMGEMEMDYDFVANFLQFCSAEDCRPDFVSFMLFPYHTRAGDNETYYERAQTAMLERDTVEMMRRLLRENDAEDCALYITEWSSSLSNRNYLNDSCFRAAYITKKISEFADQVDLIGIWMASDWMSSYYDTVKIANGGSGILTKDSIRKPAYFALDFLMRMGTTLIGKGDNYLITQRGDGNYYILCFNYKWFGINYFMEEESVRNPERLREIFEDDEPLEIDFSLEQMPADGEYIIKKRTVNEEEGCVLTAWKNFQYDRQLRISDVKYIRESCFPLMSMERGSAKNGCLNLKTSLLPHEIELLHIYQE